MKADSIRAEFLKSIKKSEDIVPLYRSDMITKSEAVQTLKRIFPVEQEHETIYSMIRHGILDAKDAWVREVTLAWVSKDIAAVQPLVQWGIYSAEEIKPFIFVHLTRLFNKERHEGTRYWEAGEYLTRLQSGNYLSEDDVARLLHSVFLTKAEVGAYNKELAMT